MEYDPEQIELLIQKVAFTHGSRLEDLFYQQKNILENHLNQLMIDHQGEAESITPEEIEGAYEIATIHVGHPSNFYGMVSDCEVLVGLTTGDDGGSHLVKKTSQTIFKIVPA